MLYANLVTKKSGKETQLVMQITLYTSVMNHAATLPRLYFDLNHAATLPQLYFDLVVVLSVDFKRFPATKHEMEDLWSVG